METTEKQQTREMEYLNHYLQMIENVINNSAISSGRKQEFAEMVSILWDLIRLYERRLDLIIKTDEESNANFKLNYEVSQNQKLQLIKLLTNIS